MTDLEPTRKGWPEDRRVDFADHEARQAWIAELRRHICSLFVVGYEGMRTRGSMGWTREQIRQHLLATKQVLDSLLRLGGLPLEPWEGVDIPLPPPRFEDVPGGVASCPSLFKDALSLTGSAEQRDRWLAYIEEQLEALVGFVLVACPEGSSGKEHQRARWAVISLRLLLPRLRLVLKEARVRG